MYLLQLTLKAHCRGADWINKTIKEEKNKARFSNFAVQ